MEIFRLTFSPIEVNTFIVSDNTGECAIIDCGCYNRKEFEKIFKEAISKTKQEFLEKNWEAKHF